MTSSGWMTTVLLDKASTHSDVISSETGQDLYSFLCLFSSCYYAGDFVSLDNSLDQGAILPLPDVGRCTTALAHHLAALRAHAAV